MKKSLIFFAMLLASSIASPVQASDDVLGIFGNANMDDDIDEKDIAYLEGVIKGTSPATNLSDANYDGKIDAQDIENIKSIIEGNEKNLTFIDSDEVPVTVKKPIKRIVVLLSSSLEVLRILDADDRVVGISQYILDNRGKFFPYISDRSSAGDVSSPDYESILSLNPDIVLLYGKTEGSSTSTAGFEENLPGVTVVRVTFNDPSIMIEEIIKLGYIIDSEEKAKEYASFVGRYLNAIETKVISYSDDKKPNVYMECPWGPYIAPTKKAGHSHQHCVMAGGNNIAANLTPNLGAAFVTVDPEWVVNQNPEIIIKTKEGKDFGYDAVNSSALASARDEILKRPELANVDAVKNGKVYVLSTDIWHTPEFFVGICYCAKWLHANDFIDLDPMAIQQEYLNKFLNLDYQLNKKSAFIYPPMDVN